MTVEEIYKEIDSKKLRLEPQIGILDKKIKSFTNWAWFFVAMGFIVAVIGIISYFFPCVAGKLTLNELGDYLAGSVASSWSLAGLFFIYVAFLGQKQQLVNQQIEILYSQAEIKATRFELEEQNKTLKQQRFENTFFQLLANHNTIVNSIDLRVQSSRSKEWSISSQGRDCFKVFYERLVNKCQTKKTLDHTLNMYIEFYQEQQADLGHYYRNMYHILKLIKETTLILDKKRYSNILRAQLSTYELALLFYNALSVNGAKKFKPLIEEFSFLKNLDRKLLLDEDHLKAYNSKSIE